MTLFLGLAGVDAACGENSFHTLLFFAEEIPSCSPPTFTEGEGEEEEEAKGASSSGAPAKGVQEAAPVTKDLLRARLPPNDP